MWEGKDCATMDVSRLSDAPRVILRRDVLQPEPRHTHMNHELPSHLSLLMLFFGSAWSVSFGLCLIPRPPKLTTHKPNTTNPPP